jgi:hypothetical protein
LGRFSQPVSGFISVAGMALIYYQTVEKQVPLSDFMAFTVAFGLVSAGFMSMTSIVIDVLPISFPVLHKIYLRRKNFRKGTIICPEMIEKRRRIRYNVKGQPARMRKLPRGK